MVTNNHPSCLKPEDCRVYRVGERLCATCAGKPPPMRDPKKQNLYFKTRRMFGPTRAKRLIIEGELG